MRILLDTNILLRLAHAESRDHADAKAAVLALVDADAELCLVPQVLYEFWVAATRPIQVNGLGMSVAGVYRSLQMLREDYPLLRDERGVFEHWLGLIVEHEVRGKPAHDARLVAAMQRHGLTHLLTFNAEDFARYPHLTVLTPAAVVAGTFD